MISFAVLNWHQERKVHPDTSNDPDQSDWSCGGCVGSMMGLQMQRRSYGMARGELIYERLTHSVIGAFYEVYNTLGFGFLEQVYVTALERELRARGHRVGREVFVPVYYKGEQIVRQRLDMVVDEKLVVEVKSTYELHGAAPRQVYNYLRATHLELGLLLHFGPHPKFYRILCRKPSTASSKIIHPNNPGHPKHPDEPSVLDARRSGDEPSVLDAVSNGPGLA